MEIDYQSNFIKNYRKRILPNRNLVERFKSRSALFIQNSSSPELRNHKLVGKKKERCSFSITGDIRVIYTLVASDKALFLDIGTHNQVY